MATIICRGLSFGYDGSAENIFESLDLVIDTGWRSALVGRNGRGKTTLLRLLSGALQPDRGEVERQAECTLFTGQSSPGLSAFEAARRAAGPFGRWERELETLLDRGDSQALEDYGELETRYRELGGYQIDARLDQELDALEIEPEIQARPFEELSGGEQTRCLLAGLFCRDRGFPLIDEPTNHLDLEGRRRLATYLAGKSGFLLVSHDRAFLDACADHVIALNRDTVETHRTSFSEWRTAFLARLDEQERSNAALRKDIRRFETTARSRRAGAEARESEKAAHTDKGFIGSRAARQMKRALAAERRADQAAESRRESLVDVEKRYDLKLPAPPRAAAPGSVLVQASNLTVVRDRPLFQPVSFRVRPGDRLAIVGTNGSGKSSLLDLIRGEVLDHSGTLAVPGHVTFSLAAQLPRWRGGMLADHLEAAGMDAGRFRQIMAALGVRGPVLDQPLERLSLGQQKKVELARSLSTSANVYLWDEPLNYIDVETREAVESLFAGDDAKQSALVMVEHDAAFIDRVATATINLQTGETD